jgi:uncharacterized membrane protein
MNPPVFAFHIAGGTIALLGGLVAVCARKGARLHRFAGMVFVIAMLIMATTADILALVIPGQQVNFLIGTFTLYLICTAWLSAHRTRGRGAEAALFAVVLSPSLSPSSLCSSPSVPRRCSIAPSRLRARC